MSRLSPFLIVVALIVGVAGWQSTKGPAGPQATIKAVDGTLSLTNSMEGAAILNVGNLAPGQSKSGVVALSNTGSLPGTLVLSQTALTDTLGPAGGQLSSALKLTLKDVVSGATLYSGPMSSMSTKDLGTMAAGENRTYSFNVMLPDTGIPVSTTTGDNAFAGSAVNVRYLWALNGTQGGGGGNGGGGSGGGSGGGGSGGGGGTGGGGSGGGPGGGGSGNPGGGSGGPLVSKMRVSVKVNVKKALKKGRVDVTVRCQEPCKIRAYAMLRKRKKMKTRRKSAVTRVANKKATIKLKLPKKVKANLKKKLAKKKKDYIVVYVRAQDPRGGVVNLKKQVRVKVKKKRR